MSDSHSIFSSISPAAYAEVAVLACVVGENMIARLDLVTMQPEVILDLGCGTGYCAGLLKNRYPKAQVVAVDDVEEMVTFAELTQTGVDHFMCADARRLPIQDHSVDLIFANFLLPWCQDWEAIFRECRRVLRAEGLLMASFLGPDTLRELHTSQLVLKDMHEIGDALMHAKFSDPVMDVEYLTLSYRDFNKMREELRVSGLLELSPELVLTQEVFSLTSEVIYGHTWGPGKPSEYAADDEGVVRIPLAHLRRR